MGSPAWTNLQNVMIMLLYFLRRLYISQALVYFQSACIFSKRLYIFKVLIFSKRFHIFKALVYFQSAYIFKALSYFQSACIFSKRLYFQSAFIYFLFVSQRLFIFSECESALFIFFFQEHYSALTLISG
jgi:hypothetical protein